MQWGLDILEVAGGRFFLIEPLSGRPSLAQGVVSGRSLGPPSPLRPLWVSVPPNFLPLPQPRSGLGEREKGEGA
jgi:hypothetical protein